MYIRELTLTNVKSFENITLSFRQSPRKAGWHVLLGDNGTGKSTILQAIALALAGRDFASLLLPYPEGWVRNDAQTAECKAKVDLSTGVRPQYDDVRFLINREPGSFPGWGSHFLSRPAVNFRNDSVDLGEFRLRHSHHALLLAGYGPFRRLSQGGREESDFPASGPARLAGHRRWTV